MLNNFSTKVQCNVLLFVFFFVALQGRDILKELILSIPLPGTAIFHHTLPRGCILLYISWAAYKIFCVLENTLVQEGNIERVNFQSSTFRNDVLYCMSPELNFGRTWREEYYILSDLKLSISICGVTVCSISLVLFVGIVGRAGQTELWLW